MSFTNSLILTFYYIRNEFRSLLNPMLSMMLSFLMILIINLFNASLVHHFNNQSEHQFLVDISNDILITPLLIDSFNKEFFNQMELVVNEIESYVSFESQNRVQRFDFMIDATTMNPLPKGHLHLNSKTASDNGIELGDVLFSDGFGFTVTSFLDDSHYDVVMNTELMTLEKDVSIFLKVYQSSTQQSLEQASTYLSKHLSISVSWIHFSLVDFMGLLVSMIDLVSKIFRVLAFVIVIISMLMIRNVMALSIHKRKNEFIILSAFGLLSKERNRLVYLEMIVMSISGLLVACAVGLILALVIGSIVMFKLKFDFVKFFLESCVVILIVFISVRKNMGQLNHLDINDAD